MIHLKLSKKNIKLLTSFAILVVILYLLVRGSSMSYTTLDSYTNIDLDQDCVFVVAAAWCGHCKMLKSSGELEKLNKNINVVLVPHDHPGADPFMQKIKGEGYPTIVMCKGRKLHKYEGHRNSAEMYKYFNTL